MPFSRVGRQEDLWDGELRPCVVGGRAVLLVRIGDEVHAYEDRCAHLGFPLSRGRLEGCVLTCAAHHYQYDVRTGTGINPRDTRLVRHAVETRDGDLYVDSEAER